MARGERGGAACDHRFSCAIVYLLKSKRICYFSSGKWTQEENDMIYKVQKSVRDSFESHWVEALCYNQIKFPTSWWQGSKLTGAQGSLAPGFPNGPNGLPISRTSYIYMHVRATEFWFGPPGFFRSGGPEGPREENRVSSPVMVPNIVYVFNTNNVP